MYALLLFGAKKDEKYEQTTQRTNEIMNIRSKLRVFIALYIGSDDRIWNVLKFDLLSFLLSREKKLNGFGYSKKDNLCASSRLHPPSVNIWLKFAGQFEMR